MKLLGNGTVKRITVIDGAGDHIHLIPHQGTRSWIGIDTGTNLMVTVPMTEDGGFDIGEAESPEFIEPSQFRSMIRNFDNEAHELPEILQLKGNTMNA